MLSPRWASPAPFRRWKPLSIVFPTLRSSRFAVDAAVRRIRGR